jgi:hypothetical protein
LVAAFDLRQRESRRNQTGEVEREAAGRAQIIDRDQCREPLTRVRSWLETVLEADWPPANWQTVIPSRLCAFFGDRRVAVGGAMPSMLAPPIF